MENTPFVLAKIMDTPYTDMGDRELIDVIISLKDELEDLEPSDPLYKRLQIELEEAQDEYENRNS